MLHLNFLAKFKGLILLCSINEHLQFHYNLYSKHLFCISGLYLRNWINYCDDILEQSFFQGFAYHVPTTHFLCLLSMRHRKGKCSPVYAEEREVERLQSSMTSVPGGSTRSLLTFLLWISIWTGAPHSLSSPAIKRQQRRWKMISQIGPRLSPPFLASVSRRFRSSGATMEISPS